MRSLSYLKTLSVFFLLNLFGLGLALAAPTWDTEPRITLPDGETGAAPAAASEATVATEIKGEATKKALKEKDRALQAQICIESQNVQDAAYNCGRCAQKAAQTCKDPQKFAEESGINAAFSQLKELAPAMGTLAAAFGGEEMAQMQCYGQALGALTSQFASETVSERCGEWREGVAGQNNGCDNICQTAGRFIQLEIRKEQQKRDIAAAANDANGVTVAQSNIAKLREAFTQSEKSHQACMQDTSKGEQSTAAQGIQLANQAAQAKSCMDGIGGDSFGGDNLNAGVEVDCDKPEFSGHPQCATIDGKTGDIGDGGLEKTLADLADSSDLTNNTDPFTPTDNAVGPVNSGKAGAGAGAGVGAGGGAGAGGIPPQAGQGQAGEGRGRGGRYSAKAKNLVGGYRSAASAGSGGSGKRRTPRKFNFKLDKEKAKAKKKDQLDALAAFAKAGIAPQPEGKSIFERITNRFSATCNPKSFYDCSRNRTSWYEQKKFKR